MLDFLDLLLGGIVFADDFDDVDDFDDEDDWDFDDSDPSDRVELDDNGILHIHGNGGGLSFLLLDEFGYDPEKIRQIQIGDVTGEIGMMSFEQVQLLKDVVLEDEIKCIGAAAFRGCKNLEKIRLSRNLKLIGGEAFGQCVSLQEIEVPDSVDTMGESAFKDCSNLKKVVLPAGLCCLPAGTFYGCSSLCEVVLPNGLERISARAFDDCKALEHIQIPDSVTELEGNAFCDCTGLREIRIPASAKLSHGAFSGCTRLERIEVAPGHIHYRSEGPLLLSKAGDLLLFAVPGISGTCTIPDSVETIGAFAFYSCNRLKKICMSDHVTRVVSRSFQGCAGLQEIVFSDSVKQLPDYVCSGCGGLVKVHLPENLETIGEEAFLESGLETVTFPAGITKLERNCFRGAPLEQIIVEGTSLAFLNLRWAGISAEGLAIRADRVPQDRISASFWTPVIRDYVLRKDRGEPIPADVEQRCQSYLQRHRQSLWKEPVCRNQILLQHLITARDFSRFLDMTEKEKNPALTARLLQYKQDQGLEADMNRLEAERQRQESRLLGRLTPTAAELRKIWKSRKWNATDEYLYSYRGSEPEVIVPSVIGKSRIVGISAGCFSSSDDFGADKYTVKISRKQIRSITLTEGILEIGDQAFAGCTQLSRLIIPASVLIIGNKAFAMTSLEELDIPEQVLWIGNAAFFGSPLKRLIIRGMRTQLCSVARGADFSLDTVLLAPEGSRAEYWARENQVPFQPLPKEEDSKGSAT